MCQYTLVALRMWCNRLTVQCARVRLNVQSLSLTHTHLILLFYFGFHVEQWVSGGVQLLILKAYKSRLLYTLTNKRKWLRTEVNIWESYLSLFRVICPIVHMKLTSFITSLLGLKNVLPKMYLVNTRYSNTFCQTARQQGADDWRGQPWC